MRRFQCTNREFISFTFRKIYTEVECPDESIRTHPKSVYLIDDVGTEHEMWPEWIYHNFKELPGDELVPEPFVIRRASTEGLKIQDERLTLRGFLICAAVGFMVALTIVAYFWYI